MRRRRTAEDEKHASRGVGTRRARVPAPRAESRHSACLSGDLVARDGHGFNQIRIFRSTHRRSPKLLCPRMQSGERASASQSRPSPIPGRIFAADTVCHRKTLTYKSPRAHRQRGESQPWTLRQLRTFAPDRRSGDRKWRHRERSYLPRQSRRSRTSSPHTRQPSARAV